MCRTGDKATYGTGDKHRLRDICEDPAGGKIPTHSLSNSKYAEGSMANKQKTVAEKMIITKRRPKPRMILGISGPTSCGKTTLAGLLKIVLEAANLTNVTVLHQDDYFKDVNKCCKEWYPDPSDRDIACYYVANSSRDDDGKISNKIKRIFCEVNGFSKEAQGFGGDLKQGLLGFRSDPTISVTRIEHKIASRHEKPFQLIYGSDRDCIASINFKDLCDNVQKLGNGKTIFVRPETARKCINVARQALTDACPEICELIEKLRKAIRDMIHNATALNHSAGFPGRLVCGGKLCKLGIVEGFLLYHEPCTPQDAENRYGGLPNDDVRHLHADIGQIFVAIDVKLFIPEMRETCRARRFAREEYMDVDSVGSRGPKETWQTKLYFDGVAWPNYLSSANWLFPNGDIEGVAARDRNIKIIDSATEMDASNRREMFELFNDNTAGHTPQQGAVHGPSKKTADKEVRDDTKCEIQDDNDEGSAIDDEAKMFPIRNHILDMYDYLAAPAPTFSNDGPSPSPTAAGVIVCQRRAQTPWELLEWAVMEGLIAKVQELEAQAREEFVAEREARE